MAECLIPLFVLVTLAGVAIAFVRFGKAERRRQIAGLESVAERWGGQVTSGERFSPISQFNSPVVRIRVDGAQGEISFDENWSRVRVESPVAQRLRVTGNFEGVFRFMMGGQEIQTGDLEFDKMFWIEASDSEWASRLLTRSAVRSRLVQFHEENQIRLDLGPAGLDLRAAGNHSYDPDFVNRLIGLAALIIKESRVDVRVKMGALVTGEGSPCPVSGDKVKVADERCPECRTPHHKDCWSYAGGCAIFACAGRARRPSRS